MYAEGSPHPVSRRLPHGGHPGRSGIQVGGFGGGIGDCPGEAGQGCWGAQPQRATCAGVCPPPPGLLHPAKASGIWGIFALALVPLGAIVL